MIIDIDNLQPFPDELDAFYKSRVWDKDMYISRPLPEALQAAIDRHVAKSAETVARIPYHKRTIISKWEIG